jgi:hypothetical protein
MAVEYNRKSFFGAKAAVIITDSFTATVSTAKAGIFKGLETMIIEGRWPSGRPCGKIVYVSSSRKSDRHQFHDLIVVGLNEAGEEGHDLEFALQSVIDFLKSKGIVSEAINLA